MCNTRIHRFPFFFISQLRINGAMSQFYSSLRDIWKYLTLSLSLSLYDPTAMILHHFDLYTQQPYRGYDDLTMMSSSHWRHHHSLTWPLRTTSFLYSLAPSLSSSRSSSRPSRLLRSLYLFRKLNGRVLSHSCGYSFRQRAWPSFRDIRISRISSDTIDSQFLKGSFLLPFDSIISFYSRWNFLGYFDASDIDFSSPFSNIISFFFFLFLFLFIGLLVLSEIGNRLGWVIVK